MRIVHLTSVHPRYDIRIFRKECMSLAKAGHDVDLVVADGKGNEKKNGVQIIDAGLKPTSRIKRMVLTGARVYKAARQADADVYHFHDPELLPVGWLLKRKGKKAIYDVHEDVPRQILSKHWISPVFRKPVSAFVEFAETLLARSLSGVVCATPKIEKRFERINKNVATICNYPILQELYIPDVDWEKKEQAACYIGGITRTRGLFEMVAAAEFMNGPLYIAGPVTNQQEYQKAASMSGWSNVRYLGVLDREGVRDLLRRSSVGLVLLQPTPNYYEALPVKMFEYMSASVPVVASDFPLWKEIVEENNCGICVNNKEPKEIAEAVNELLDQPSKASSLGKNGRIAVEGKYSWEKEFAKLKKFLETLLWA